MPPGHPRAAAVAPPRGRCPACRATGPLVVDRVGGGQPRPVVFGCTCVKPPAPLPVIS